MKNIKNTLTILLLLTSIQSVVAQNQSKEPIIKMLDAWHQAAANANFDAYFDVMEEDAIFIGTDATEHWDKTAFQAFAKPYFDKGKAWDFRKIERHIEISKDGKIAWFDERISTWMKDCRGSGVLVKVGKEWKIQHYVLSMTIPNDEVDAVTKIKAPIEDALIAKLQKK